MSLEKIRALELQGPFSRNKDTVPQPIVSKARTMFRVSVRFFVVNASRQLEAIVQIELAVSIGSQSQLARMMGWTTRSFREKSFFHYRTLGTAERGLLASSFFIW